MNIFQFLFWCLVTFAIIYALVRVFTEIEISGAVTPPRHITYEEMNTAPAQDVYNWAVYATRMIGTPFLERLDWNERSPHNFMLGCFRAMLHDSNEDWRPQRMRNIGRNFKLNTNIVDEPF